MGLGPLIKTRYGLYYAEPYNYLRDHKVAVMMSTILELRIVDTDKKPAHLGDLSDDNLRFIVELMGGCSTTKEAVDYYKSVTGVSN